MLSRTARPPPLIPRAEAGPGRGVAQRAERRAERGVGGAFPRHPWAASIGAMDLRNIVLVERRDQVKEAVEANRGLSVALIGSVARGDYTPESDYDFVVSFQKSSDVFDHARLELALEDILGRSVDVISRGALTERSRHVLDHAIDL